MKDEAMNKSEVLDHFREIFWDAFHRPDLKTDRYYQLWHRLEHISDLLAGPMFSVFEKGEYDYVFQDKNRFPNMHSADDFMDWCMEKINHYQEALIAEVPTNEPERKDQQLLSYQTEVMMQLAEMAYFLKTSENL